MFKVLSSKIVGGVFILAAVLKLISIDEFEIYFGQLPEQGFALDYHYGKYECEAGYW